MTIMHGTLFNPLQIHWLLGTLELPWLPPYQATHIITPSENHILGEGEKKRVYSETQFDFNQ